MITFSRAAAALARRDPVMATLIDRSAPFNLPRRATRHFAALAESILYQQLAGAAAAAIHRRFLDLFDGDLSPETLLALPARKLRAAGVSEAKVAAVRDLGRRSRLESFHSIASGGFPTRGSSNRCRWSVASDGGPPRCS